MVNSPFTIYDAAAGSGKTFTLVKEYLKLVLQAKDPSYYKHILAITFTNKAVAEMKSRIIENLVAFSPPIAITNPSEMMLQIASEINSTPTLIQAQTKKIVKHLLHHYGSFSVETIDRFNHTLLRTFARDLSLSSNFEVSLDTDILLAEAVDSLISKAGENEFITKLLIDYALEKTDDDKSWDISKDIAKTAKIIYNETDGPHLKKLADKSLVDFQTLKKELKVKKQAAETKAIEIAQQALKLIQEAGLEHTDFTGGQRAYFPKYLSKLSEANFDVSFGTAWQETMGEKPMYPKSSTRPEIAETIDTLAPQFKKLFDQSKVYVSTREKYNNLLKNLTPLSVINLVNQELQILKDEKNVLPISEFNALINSEIKNQPAPFIYERLGERYRHFFIDEFQDTSLLQWENLIPLIDNSLSQESQNGLPGSLLLVGDAKQSIYRWRGGLPEQFIGLTQKQHPFSVSTLTVENLPVNYRSCENIISFNNSFFNFVSTFFGDATHRQLYEIGNNQATNNKKGGYVELTFNAAEDDKNEWYGENVLQTINNLKQNGFQNKDICVLTRRKKDGITLSTYLMERGISIISSETLLLQNSALVQCIINSITLSLYPENETVQISLLDFIHAHFNISEEKHAFFVKFLADKTSLEQFLTDYHIDLNVNLLNEISLYEGCEYIIKQLSLDRIADAYLFGIMDFIFDFEQQPQADKMRFLSYWETKKDKASIAASDSADAVQFMTIHKAKGLEFPVVIFPYADQSIYYQKDATAWFPLAENQGGFEESLINYKSDIAHYNDYGEALATVRQQTLELDSFNTLYVTLTRAVEQLYIFSDKPSKIQKGEVKNFSQIFSEYLKAENKWVDLQTVYSFGKMLPKQIFSDQDTSEEKTRQIQPDYISSFPEANNLKLVTKEAFLWQTEAGEAIESGNLLHESMSQVISKTDISEVIDNLKSRAIYASEEIALLEGTMTKLVNHPELSMYFEADVVVKNERTIITAMGQMLIPDRLNFMDNAVTILDYKTGIKSENHASQINSYAVALEAMGFSISEKIIVYTSKGDISINKV